MSLVGEPPFFPRLPGQQADVMPASPTAIVALFAEIVRERFRPANGLPWVFSDGVTPAPNETGDLDGPRKVLIEPAFSQHVEARDYRPAIYIDKGDTSAEKVALGNLAGRHLPSGLAGFYALSLIPMDVECVSDQRGESATLADTVWFYVIAGREQIQSTFGLHEVSLPILGKTLPGDKDKTEWTTHVTFSVQAHLRWTTKPIAPLLASIVLRYRESGETNPDVFLLEEHLP
jgi:hypothetical protein